MSDVDWLERLTLARLASVSFRDADGYMSLRLRTNEEAAEQALNIVGARLTRADKAEATLALISAYLDEGHWNDEHDMYDDLRALLEQRKIHAAHGEGVIYTGPDNITRLRVREEPIPPLSTEPYTVIRAIGPEFKDDDSATFGFVGGRWCAIWGDGELDARSITGFEVLAEPRTTWGRVMASAIEHAQNEERSETAKAVLDRVRRVRPTPMQSAELGRIAREFGVDGA